MTIINLVLYYTLIGTAYALLSLSIAKSKVDGELIKGDVIDKTFKILLLASFATLFWPLYVYQEVRRSL